MFTHTRRTANCGSQEVPPMAVRWRIRLLVGVALAVSLAGIVGATRALSLDPRPGAVSGRLAHARLDPISTPTWPPNEDDLPAVARALGLPAASDRVPHPHALLRVFVNGAQVAVPGGIGLSPSYTASLHTHPGMPGVIHVEAADPSDRATLGQFFDVWGVFLSDRCLGGYCGGVHVWVNGAMQTSVRDLVLHDGDAITIVAGRPPAR
jgi:hypothetical protein